MIDAFTISPRRLPNSIREVRVRRMENNALVKTGFYGLIVFKDPRKVSIPIGPYKTESQLWMAVYDTIRLRKIRD